MVQLHEREQNGAIVKHFVILSRKQNGAIVKLKKITVVNILKAICSQDVQLLRGSNIFQSRKRMWVRIPLAPHLSKKFITLIH